MPENQFRSQLPTTLLLSALLAATITLIEPAKSAIGNWSEIVIGFERLFTRLVVPFAIAFSAIAALGAVLIALAPRRGLPLLVALFAALWAQGNLFVWQYGTFDGSPIDWSEHSGKGFLELAFWVGALVVALTRHAWVRRRVLPIAAITFSLQLAALVGQVHNHAPFSRPVDSETQVVHRGGTTDLSLIRSVSRFSTDLNVIIVVLDSLQSDFFAEVIRDPELRASMPPGFTYYRNAISLYARTEFSVQSIMTSRAIPDNVYIKEWKNEHRDQTLPATLSRNGFDAVLMSVVKGQYQKFGSWGWRRVLGEAIADTESETTVWREDVSNLFALGLFRLSPHFLKPRIYDDGSWQVRQLYPPHETRGRNPKLHWGTRVDLAVYDELLDSVSADDTAPRFRLLHFWGSHVPYVVDEECRFSGRKYDRESATSATHCAISRVFALFQKLDELGVYDRSVIFVLADHGIGGVELDPSMASPALPESGVPFELTEQQLESRLEKWWRGVPLFLAKPLGDRQPMRVSDRPVSLCDVPESVVDALSIEGNFECESIFAARSERRTPRLHYRYPDEAPRKELHLSAEDGLPFEKHSVQGHSWRSDSWIPLDVDAD